MTGSSVHPWQRAVWRPLVSALADGRLGHALLISGVSGLGKTALADRLAASILCGAGSGGPCGRCTACDLLTAGTHPDLYRLGPPEDKTVIPIEMVRRLSSDLQLKSHAGRAKVALVDPADTLTMNAANSFLKTLEEPPAASYLILVTSRPMRLPATIRSRCQRVDLASPDRASALTWLKEEAGHRDDWPLLLEHAGGAPLAALALAEAGYSELAGGFAEDLTALIEGRTDVTRVAERWKAEDDRLVLQWLFRACAGLARVCAGAGTEEPVFLQNLAQRIDLARLLEYLDQVQEALRLLDTTINRQFLHEWLLVPWAGRLLKAGPAEG